MRIHFLLCMLRIAGTHAIISKCIGKGEDTVTLACPEGHVIYDPVIFVGVSMRGTCSYEDGDCTGLTSELLTQRNKCFWQQRCTLRWRDQQPIVFSDSAQCRGKHPHYVNLENPLCVPKGLVVDVCDHSVKAVETQLNHGIIRSHPSYPWTYSLGEHHCNVSLPARPGHKLILNVQDVNLAGSDVLSVARDNQTGFERVTKDTGPLTTTGNVQVSFKLKDEENGGNGFILRYEFSALCWMIVIHVPHMPLQGFHSNTGEGKHGGTIDLFQDSLFNVVGAIEECITPRKEQINITCPPAHVIYKPEVKVGVSKDGRCSYRLGDCTGMSHTLLTQRNVCYWKENCEFSWRSGVPITMSETLRCLSQPPKYISLSGYSCIKEEKVTNLCDEGKKNIEMLNGVIKSHSEYPWHYKAEKLTCRKRIKIPRGAQLRMRTVDIDLDPDTKGDNVRVYHIKQGKKKLRSRLRGNKDIDETFAGGCVEVMFRVSPRSKSGRGFVMKFESDADVNSVHEFHECSVRSTKSRRNKHKRSRNRKGKRIKGEKRKRNKKPNKRKGRKNRRKTRT